MLTLPVHISPFTILYGHAFFNSFPQILKNVNGVLSLSYNRGVYPHTVVF